MPFDKVDTQVDFPAQERAMLAFWEKEGIFERLRAQNRGTFAPRTIASPWRSGPLLSAPPPD